MGVLHAFGEPTSAEVQCLGILWQEVDDAFNLRGDFAEDYATALAQCRSVPEAMRKLHALYGASMITAGRFDRPLAAVHRISRDDHAALVAFARSEQVTPHDVDTPRELRAVVDRFRQRAPTLFD